MLLAFAPFVAFAVLNHFVAPVIALAVAALVSLVLTGREVMLGHSAKILEVGTCILFSGLALYVYLSKANWPVIEVKLIVDIGLTAVVAFSLLIGRPFTLQYARERVPQELWSSPQFLRTNQIITLVWLAAFAAIILADLILLYMPNVPQKVGVFLTIGALYGAFKFTQSYPEKAAA
jgi:hypothetical protein